MENDTDRKRQHMMGAPVAPAANASQAAIDMAADIDRRAGPPRPTPHPDVSESFGQILLKLAASGAAMLAGVAVIVLSESNIFFGAVLGFGGVLFGLVMLGRLLSKIAGSVR